MHDCSSHSLLFIHEMSQCAVIIKEITLGAVKTGVNHRPDDIFLPVYAGLFDQI